MSRLSPLQAIMKKCLECSGDDKNEVEECELVKCPLHGFRLGAATAATMLTPTPAPKKPDKKPSVKQLKLF